MTASADHIMRVSGPLLMEATIDLFNKGLQVVEGAGELVVDMKYVEAVDSSAVSLMLVWLRTAQRRDVKLAFINVPENLLSLTQLYGVSETLPIRAA